MGSDPRDGNLPDYAVRQIRIKARKLAGHYGFGRSDQEDIQQELTIEVWRRLPEFNPTRGSLEVFVYWLIKRARATLIERQTAKKRGGGRCTRSLDSPIRGTDGGLTSASEVMDEGEAGRRLGLDRQHFTAQSDLRTEFETFVDGLRADLRDLCERLLVNPNLTDVSRETGIPRGTLYERREELRRLMEKAGLQKYHSSSGASDAPPVGHQ